MKDEIRNGVSIELTASKVRSEKMKKMDEKSNMYSYEKTKSDALYEIWVLLGQSSKYKNGYVSKIIWTYPKND